MERNRLPLHERNVYCGVHAFASAVSKPARRSGRVPLSRAGGVRAPAARKAERRTSILASIAIGAGVKRCCGGRRLRQRLLVVVGIIWGCHILRQWRRSRRIPHAAIISPALNAASLRRRGSLCPLRGAQPRLRVYHSHRTKSKVLRGLREPMRRCGARGPFWGPPSGVDHRDPGCPRQALPRGWEAPHGEGRFCPWDDSGRPISSSVQDWWLT